MKKSKDKQIKKLKTFLFIILLLIFVHYFILFSHNVLIPSYYSYLYACNRPKADAIGIIAIGVTYNTYNETTNKYDIKVNLTQYADKSTIKHEWVHVKQRERKVWPQASCQFFGITDYLNEMEAYTSQDLPDNIYVLIYGVPKIQV